MRAFTLFELLLVLFLISLSLGLLLPRLGRLSPRGPQGFLEETSYLLNRARLQAQEKQRAVLVLINSEQRKIMACKAPVNPEKWACFQEISIPEEVEIKAEGLLVWEDFPGVLFLPDGSSSGGELEIINHRLGQRYLFRVLRLLDWQEAQRLD